MLLEKIVRGNIVTFTVTFTDATGEEVSPVSAALHVSYMDAGGRTEDEIAMTQNTDGAWTGEWDSSIANAGRVHWSARATDPTAAEDGKFELVANLANPDDGSS